MERMESLADQLPAGVGVNWTGMSYEERQSGAQAPALYALSLLVVFLCLAALYESWTIPLAVLIVRAARPRSARRSPPTCAASPTTSISKSACSTTMGLAAKNAILIVEFARNLAEQGRSWAEAAMEAARIRMRPILMTSFAFIFGVLPMALASGAGSGAQNAIGTAVIGGMLAATLLVPLLTPFFFVEVNKLFERDWFKRREPKARGGRARGPRGAGRDSRTEHRRRRRQGRRQRGARGLPAGILAGGGRRGEGFVPSEFAYHGPASSTGGSAIALIVNGPIAARIGIKSGNNLFGQGLAPNATIGRAVRLIMMNVMHTRPGLLDRATLGNPGKYSFCFAENEEDRPWEPLHVARGLRREHSAVTVFASNSLYQVYNQLAAEPEPLLLCFADALGNLGTSNVNGFNQALLVFAGEHTEVLGKAGWSRCGSRFIIEHARRTVADYKRGARLPGELTPADETTWRTSSNVPRTS